MVFSQALQGFANLKIRSKVFLGFGAVLVIMTIAAGTGYVSFLSTGRQVAVFADRAEASDAVAGIDRQFMTLQALEIEYLYTSSDAVLKEIKDQSQPLRDQIAAALKISAAGPRHAALLTVQSRANDYLAGLNRLIELIQKRDKEIVLTLSSDGDDLNDALTSLVDGLGGDKDPTASPANGKRTEFLGLRQRIADLTNHFSPQGLAQVQQSMTGWSQGMSALLPRIQHPERQKQLQDILKSFKDFTAAFDGVARMEQQIYSLSTQDLAAAQTELEKTTGQVRESASTERRQAQDATTDLVSSSTVLVLVLTSAGVVLGISISWLLGQSVAGPVVAMTSAMGRLAEGDNAADIPALGRGDELGAMAKAVLVFKENAIRVTRLQSEQEEAKRRAEEDRKQAMHELADSFEASISGVVDAVSSASTEMQATAQAMAETAELTSRQSTAVAAAADEASSNVQTVAAAAEELTSSISEIAQQVSQSAEIAQGAVKEAKQTNELVQGLALAAQRIGEVVGLINDIASQTNLLALNATIEAARAGEAGKGFAVVASEVKNLANQTARATEEISGQIGAIQEATRNAVGAIEGIGGTISQINEIASAIAAAVEEQGAATKEIARNVQQASAGTTEVSANIAGVTQAAGETGQAAGQVLESATDLSRQSESLREQVAGFLSTVRNA